MRSFWSDPYLWVHVAGLAAVPIFLEFCLIGFAVGDPLLPAWVELLLVAAIGISPILWMQWQRPFYIFSLVAVALQPEQLTDDQRRLLTLFKSERNRIVAVIVPVGLFLLLYKVYQASPLAVAVLAFPGGWRLGGLLLAAIGFLGCNLFTQVPVSVAGVMLHSDSSFTATNPYPVNQIRQQFSVLGLPVRTILPAFVAEPGSIVATSPVVTSPAVEPKATISSTPETPVEVDVSQPETVAPDISAVPEAATPQESALDTATDDQPDAASTGDDVWGE